MSKVKELVDSVIPLLEQGGEREISKALVDDIKKWNSPPSALEILYSLDINAYFALSSGFITQVIMSIYSVALEEENITGEVVEEQARKLWRHEGDWASNPRPNFSVDKS